MTRILDMITADIHQNEIGPVAVVKAWREALGAAASRRGIGNGRLIITTLDRIISHVVAEMPGSEHAFRERCDDDLREATDRNFMKDLPPVPPPDITIAPHPFMQQVLLKLARIRAFFDCDLGKIQSEPYRLARLYDWPDWLRGISCVSHLPNGQSNDIRRPYYETKPRRLDEIAWLREHTTAPWQWTGGHIRFSSEIDAAMFRLHFGHEMNFVGRAKRN